MLRSSGQIGRPSRRPWHRPSQGETSRMQFGIAIPTAADSWRLVRRAEELGFSNAWFFDTQMLSADPFVAMAAAAMKTDADQARHRRADPVQPHRPGRGHCVRLAEQAGAGPDRFRHQHRLHRPPHHGPAGGQAGGHGGIHPRRPGAVARRDGGDRDRRQTAENPFPVAASRPDQHAGSDAALHRRDRAARPGADREARRGVDRQRGRRRARRRGAGANAHGLGAGGTRPRIADRGRLDRRCGAG